MRASWRAPCGSICATLLHPAPGWCGGRNMAERGGPGRKAVLYLGMAGAVVLMLAGGGAFWYAAQRNAASTAGQAADMVVRVGASECRPNEITVPGGRRGFEIVNESDRPIEGEILDGVMVVAERENIAPAFARS